MAKKQRTAEHFRTVREDTPPDPIDAVFAWHTVLTISDLKDRMRKVARIPETAADKAIAYWVNNNKIRRAAGTRIAYERIGQ